MSSHRAIPTCTGPRAPNTTGTTWVRHCHMRLTSIRRSPYMANFSACFLPTLPSAGQLMSMRRQVLAFLSLRQMSGRLAGFDLPYSGDGRIPHHYDIISLHMRIRLMPIPPALHWNLKMPTNVPVNDGGDLNVSISVVCRCHCSIQPATMWSTVSTGPAEQGRPGGPWPTQLQKIVLQPDGDLAELPVKGMR